MATLCGSGEKCPRQCSNNFCAYVELVIGYQSVCGDRTGGFARQLQSIICLNAIGAQRGSALGPLVCVYQPGAQPSEGFVLGRQRTMGMRQAVGEGSLLLAQGG